jgi:hypothetical protein
MRNPFRSSMIVFGLATSAGAQSPVSIQDAIAMVRVPHFWGEQPFFAISPDGKSGAAVTWQGDIGRNVNLYKVYVFDVASVLKNKRLPAPAAELQFKGDTNDYGFRITGVDRISTASRGSCAGSPTIRRKFVPMQWERTASWRSSPPRRDTPISHSATDSDSSLETAA